MSLEVIDEILSEGSPVVLEDVEVARMRCARRMVAEELTVKAGQRHTLRLLYNKLLDAHDEGRIEFTAWAGEMLRLLRESKR